ncbi:MAG: hypothetical protein HY926_10535 [Elusimicrobia bacterium]|nr:hypothetical protein [Elusimicrobiota bacterium]
MTIVLIVAGVAAVSVLAWFVWCASRSAAKKPAQFREPIASGHYRLVASDEVGGAELSRVVGDFPTFETAHKEAVKARADSELQVGSKGVPTKFLIYDEQEAFVGDWTGRKSAA